MKYFIQTDGRVEGPFSFIDVTKKPIVENTLICTDAPDGGWKEAHEYTEFLHLFQSSQTTGRENTSTQGPANATSQSQRSPEPGSSQQTTLEQNIEVTHLPPDCEIDKNGQIVKKDYAFRSAKQRPDAPLPTNRGYATTIFITIVTCGIYGLILPFLMGGETNITCSEDGEHTPDFWKSLFLSLITFGFYGCFWNYNWCNREANFLHKHDSIPLITGSAYVASSFVSIIMIIIGLFFPTLLGIILLLLGMVIFLAIVGRMNIQHNLVNKAYNVENFLLKPDPEDNGGLL